MKQFFCWKILWEHRMILRGENFSVGNFSKNSQLKTVSCWKILWEHRMIYGGQTFQWESFQKTGGTKTFLLENPLRTQNDFTETNFPWEIFLKKVRGNFFCRIFPILWEYRMTLRFGSWKPFEKIVFSKLFLLEVLWHSNKN